MATCSFAVMNHSVWPSSVKTVSLHFNWFNNIFRYLVDIWNIKYRVIFELLSSKKSWDWEKLLICIYRSRSGILMKSVITHMFNMNRWYKYGIISLYFRYMYVKLVSKFHRHLTSYVDGLTTILLNKTRTNTFPIPIQKSKLKIYVESKFNITWYY